MESRSSRWDGAALLAIVAVLVTTPRMGLSGSVMWWANLLLLALFTFVAGHWVTGFWRGAFINDRNRISLSQFQLVLWTVLVLSAFLTIAFINLANQDPDALSIQVPTSLWILMGISTTSLVGSPLVASGKKSQGADPVEEAEALNRLHDQGRAGSDLTTHGRLLANQKPGDARWSEIFEAEELSRAGRLDLGKIQMFYFTVILAVAYGTSLATAISQIGAGQFLHAFPPLDQSMIALLGISHAGFLAGKAVPERGNLPAAPAPRRPPPPTPTRPTPPPPPTPPPTATPTAAAPAPSASGSAPAPGASGSAPAPSASGSAPAPGASGSAPAPGASGSAPAPSDPTAAAPVPPADPTATPPDAAATPPDPASAPIDAEPT